MKKTILTLLCMLLMISASVVYADNTDVVLNGKICDGGTCGESVNWSYSDEGELVIYGKGDMYDYEPNSYPVSSPWSKVGDNIFSVIICDGITSIGTGAFGYSPNISAISMPESVTRIGKNAFSCCECIRSLTVPEGVEVIEDGAFACFFYAETLSLPSSIKKIGDGAFDGWDHVKEIYYNGTFEQWNKVAIAGNNDPLKNTEIHFLKTSEANTEPATVRFGKCGDHIVWELSEEGVLTITGKGNMFDYDHHSLDNVDSGSWFGLAYDEIRSVIIGNGVKNVGAHAFERCENLESVFLGDSVKTIGDSAFSDCYNLSAVSFNENIKYIGDDAFKRCDLLSINLPKGVKYIGSHAFADNELVDVFIPETVKEIGYSAFENTRWLEHYPNDFVICGDGVLIAYLGNEEEVIVPSNVKMISEAFRRKENLKRVFLQEGVEILGEEAFAYNPLLSVIYIPKSLKRIDENAFKDSWLINTVYYSGKMKNWEKIEVEYGNDLLECSNIEFKSPKLSNISLPVTTIAKGSCGSGLMWILTSDHILRISGRGAMCDVDIYGQEGTFPSELWGDYSDEIRTVIVSEGVTRIGNWAFYECSHLSHVELPDSLEEIGKFAFSECDWLGNITIPKNVRKIEAYALGSFFSGSNLEIINLPDGIVEIAETAFEGTPWQRKQE